MALTKKLRTMVDQPVWEWMRYSPFSSGIANTLYRWPAAATGSRYNRYIWATSATTMYTYDTYSDSWNTWGTLLPNSPASTVGGGWDLSNGHYGYMINAVSGSSVATGSFINESAVVGQTIKIVSGTGTGQGSQLEILSRPEFGGDMAVPETVAALRGNLPTTIDPVKANAAALQFLAATDPGKYAELTAKQDTLPADIRSAMAFMQLTPEQKTAYEKIKTMSAPKTIVDMTGGQKGFENEMTLKKTFAAEPVYKAYSEMQSAYGQITDSLKQATVSISRSNPYSYKSHTRAKWF